MTISISGMMLRFLLGGSAVAASAVIGHRLGGRVGGIFAAFPAVFASAVISTAIGLPKNVALQRTAAMSSGALIGMTLDIGCAALAGILICKMGWKKGLAVSISGWMVAASLVYVGGAAAGWLR